MRSDSVFSASSLQAHIALILLCGLALALSIQPSTAIGAVYSSDIAFPPGLFHIAFAFLFGAYAVNRGAVIAAETPTKAVRFGLIVRFAEHIIYGLLLLLPYLIFSRALLPSGAAGVAALTAHVAVASFLFSLISYRLELRGYRRRRGAFLHRYGLYALMCLLPFAIGMSHSSLKVVAAISPIGLAFRLLVGVSVIELVVGFLVSIAGILFMLVRLRRIDRRPHAL